VGADKDFAYLADLGIKAGDSNATWGGVGGIETVKGQYDFSKLDKVVSGLKNAGVSNICLSIYLQNSLYNISGGNFTTDSQWTGYGNFLSALIKHYPEVNCYQSPREANTFQLNATPQVYAKIIKFTSEKIKGLNPKAMIVLAGLPYDLRVKDGRENYLKETIASLPTDKKYFDAIDIHLHLGYWKSNGTAGVTSAFNFYKGQLSGTYANSKIFFETSAYTGTIQDNKYNYPRQTEQDQADDIISRLNKLAELGAYRVNLEGGVWQRPYFLFTGAGKTGHIVYFEHNGLIWDCSVDKDTDNGSCTTGTKKKAYSALKDWIKK
jgi:hypothetical protein